MQMRKLIARSSHSYGTRRLKAGDEYEATEMHARLLVGARRARYAVLEKTAELAPAIGEKAEAKEQAVVQEQAGDLRAQAERLGIAVDGRWGVARLQHEISQARRR
jgi:hypothetical protein